LTVVGSTPPPPPPAPAPAPAPTPTPADPEKHVPRQLPVPVTEHEVTGGGKLSGGSGHDLLRGSGTSDDLLIGGAGDDLLVGGGGLDTAQYTGRVADFVIERGLNGVSVRDTAHAEGHDLTIEVERLQFSDGFVALDLNGNAGRVAALYQAAFERSPDKMGMGFWLDKHDHNTDIRTIAKEFVRSAEFAQTYGTTGTVEKFIGAFYEHTLHREPDKAGFDWWVARVKELNVPLDQELQTTLLIDFSLSDESIATIVGSFPAGIAFSL
jgi:serralysin